MNKDFLSREGSGFPRTSRQCTHRDPHQPSGGSRGNGRSCRPSPSRFHEDHRREIETLRAELETERLRSKEARHRFAVEVQELREAAKRDRQLLGDQIRSKLEQQRIRELQQQTEDTKKQREAEIRQLLRWKEAELREAQQLLQHERDAAMRQARELQRQLAKELVSNGSGSRGARGEGSGGQLSAERRAKLEEVLGKLRWEVDGDQAARIRHLEAELELERRLFLKYILERFEGEPLLAGSLERFRQASSLPEGKVKSGRAAGEGDQKGLPQQGWCSGDSYNQLRKENTDLLNARKVLEERCTHLEEENARLRESSLPDIQDKAKRLRGKSAQLAAIAKRLEEAAQKLQESALRVSNTPGPLALNCSEREPCENVLAQQQAKDWNEQDSVLLAKDQKIDALQKECQELQAQLSARQEDNSLLSTSNLDGLLRESQREVLQLQRQTALKSQRDSLQTSTIAANGSSSSGIKQETSSTFPVCLEDSSEAKKKPKTQNIWVKDAETQAQPFGSEAKNDKNSTLKTESKNESHSKLSETQLVEKRKLCENLTHKLEGIQKRCDEAELKFHKILCENARLSKENYQFHGENKWAEKMANENADLKLKLIQLTEERNSVVLLTQRLGVQVENLEQELKNMKETAERQQQLDSETEKTLLELPKKEEEMQQVQQTQTEIKREHDGEGHLLETQVKELEHRYPSQTELVNLLNSEEDTAGELEEWKLSIQRHLEKQNPFRLRCFLARYSYDPFKGPNQNPEAELPLTAGEHVYVCGEMDEDGFYVGELMDGRRGFVPSNFVEEVEGNDPFSFIPSEPSNISDDSFHEPSFFCQRASCEEKSNSPDEDRRDSLLSDGQEGTLCEVQAAAPYHPNVTVLTLRNITVTSAEITWFPSNHSYTHLVYLNDKKFDVTKAGIDCYIFQNLTPSTPYSVKVEPLVPREALGYPQGWLEQKATEMTFTTPSAGPPHAPLDVQVQAGSSADNLLISWLPETIHPSGLSNGVRVTGYAIYVSGQKVTEIMSPTAGSVSLDVPQVKPFQGAHTVSVRTVSPFGESADSVPTLIPSDLWKVPSTVLFQSVASGQISTELLESATEDTDKESKLAHRKLGVMTTEDSSSESSLENWDENSWSHEASVSSLESEPTWDTDVDTSDIYFRDIFPVKDQGQQIKQLCKEFSQLTVSQVAAQDDTTFRRGSWRVSMGDYSRHYGLSDIEEEEEEDQGSPQCMSDEDLCQPQKPESPIEVTPSTSHSGPQINVASGASANISCNEVAEIQMDHVEVKGYLLTKAYAGWKLMKKLVDLYRK